MRLSHYRLRTITLLALAAAMLLMQPLHAVAQEQCTIRYIGASVVLAIDTSTSMSLPASGGQTKMAAATAAASQFVDTMTNGSDQLAVVSFAGPNQVNTVMNIQSTASEEVRSSARARIRQLDVVADDNGTDISAGLSASTRALAGARAGTNRVIILLTDGAATQPGGRDVAPSYALEAAREATNAGASIYTIGLRLGDQQTSEQAARNLLTEIARSGHGRFREAPSGSELAEIYGEISTAIRECQAPAPAAPMPVTGVEGNPLRFPETGLSLDGEFRTFWDAHGGLPVFGYPITSAAQSGGRVSQWLERTRFELHPENAAPYTVLLGRLGEEALARQGRSWQRLPKADPATAHYFQETGHAIDNEAFWAYWSSHGLELDGVRGTSFAESLALFGYPLSEPAMETNAAGDTVLTQWFERARFEYHPTNPSASRVLLGLLGREVHSAGGGR